MNEYDALIQADQDQQRQNLRATALATSAQNPDEYAKAKQLSKVTGLPAPVVARNLPEVQQKVELNDYDKLLGASPLLAAHMQNPDFAILSKDDTKGMSDVEALLAGRLGFGRIGGPAFRRNVGTVEPAQGPAPNLSAITSGLLKAFPQGVEALRQGARFQWADLFGNEEMQADAAHKAAQVQGDIFRSTPAFETSTGSGLYGGGVSLMRQAPSTVASIVTRNPAFALGSAGAQTEAEAYSKYRLRGATPLEALTGAVGEGGVEVATELIPMSFLVKKFGKTGAGEFLTGLLAREVPTEQIATFVQDAIDTAVANPDKTWKQFFDERPDAAYQTLLATLVQSGAITAGHKAVQKLAPRAGQAQAAQQRAEVVAQVAELAKASKVRARDPQSFAEFVDAAAAEGPVQDVYIDARTLAQSGVVVEELAQVSPSIAEQYEQAVQTGGDVRIPLGEYSANIATSPAGEVLLPHLRTEPEGMSQAQAQEFMQSQAETFRAEAEKILAEDQANTVFRESAAKVEAYFSAQLAQANRFRQEVNSVYAGLVSSFYTVQASRLGITPEEMLKRYPLQIRAEGVTGALELDQGYKGPTMAEIEALNDTPTVDLMQEAIDTVGAEEFRRRAEAKHEKATVGGKFEVNKALTTEATAREIVALKRRDAVANAKDSAYTADRGQTYGQPGRDQSTTGTPRATSQELYATVAGGHAREGWAESTRIRGTDGRPVALHRGAAAPLAPEHFDLGALGAATGRPSAGLGVWFTVDPAEAAGYGEPENFYLDIRSPLVIKVEDLPGFDSAEVAHAWREEQRGKGHDGLIVTAKHLGGRTHVVAFEPDQVIFPPPPVSIDVNELFQSGRRKKGHDGYTQDLFGNDVSAATGENQPDGGPAPGSGSAPLSRDDAPGTFATRTEIVEENVRQIGADVVNTPEEAAQALAYLSRGAVEHFDALITDKNGKPLAIVGSFKGARSQASVYRDTLVGEAFRINGAANIWLAHNHPSGRGDLSQADRLLHQNIADAFRGSEIELKGIFAIGGKEGEGRRWSFEPNGPADADIFGVTAAPSATAAVPVVERVYKEEGKLGPPITSPREATAAARNLSGGKPGVILLDTQHVPIGFVEINPTEINQLRQDGRMDAFYRALSVSNAGAAILVNDGSMSQRGALNLAGLLNASETRVLDVMELEASGSVSSWAERGVSLGGTQFNQDAGASRGKISFAEDITQTPSVISLLKNADLSTFVHELGHFQLEVLANMAAQPNAPQQIVDDMNALLKWFGIGQEVTEHGPVSISQKDRKLGEKIRDMAERFGITPRELVASWKSKAPRRGTEQGQLWSELEGIPEIALFAAENPGKTVIENYDGREAIVGGAAVARRKGQTPLEVWFSLPMEEKRAYHEQLARGFEAYLFEGRAPNPELTGIFARVRAWMVSIYKKLTSLNVELNDEVRGVFDRLIATDEQIAAAEAARSYAPLFKTAEEGGMTPQEFAEYQGLGGEATQEAQGMLGSRGLRDMRWLSNAKNRKLKALQKEAAEKRREVRAEVRLEVLAEPVYRARRFLTGRIGAENALPKPEKSSPSVIDETRDSLFVAIAKLGGLNHDQLAREWGIDPKEKFDTVVFGKPVVRREGGLDIDSMAEGLAQYGYLTLDEYGKWDLHEFEDLFGDELRGSPQYSQAYNHGAPDARAGDQIKNPLGLTAGRLDRGSLLDLGVAPGVIDQLGRMVSNEGLHPDIVADLTGFTSGDHLIKTLIEAEPEQSAIEGLTDQRMLERYGDLATPDGLAKAVDEALHNDVRARFIATELKALERAMNARQDTGRTDTKGRRITVNILPKAAMQYAEAVIARKKVREVKPAQFTAAETRAAKAAQKAPSLAEKAVEKRNELVNHFAAKAAHEALSDVDKGLEYLKKFENAGTRKNLDPDYTDQIDRMLERFDLRRGQTLRAVDKRKALAEWITEQEALGFDPVISDKLRDEAFRTSYKDMTVEEFRGLVDAVRNIEHLGRLKHKLIVTAEGRALQAVVDELSASIQASAKRAVPERRTSDRGMLVDAAKLFRGFLADHRKFASVAREFDGWQDAGAAWEYLVRGMNKAGDTEAVMREQATMALSKLLAPVLKTGKMGKKQFFPLANKSFTREERLGIALNMGNEVNRERVITGEKLSPQALNEILATITPEEADFVQGVWDYFESYRPQIGEKEKRLTGVTPEWVEASPITLGGKQLKGGYYPIKYDPERSTRAEADSAAEVQKQMERGLYASAQTRRGHLKARVESTGRPLRYDLGVIVQHVDQVVHDLAWHEYLIDANRLLRAAPVDSAVREHYGPDKLRVLRETLTDIAVGDLAAQSAGERVLNHLRYGATITGLGWRVTTSLLQPFGLTQSVVRLGGKWVLKGARHWAGDAAHLENSVRIIGEKSDFMRLRAKTLQREINEIRNKVRGKDSRLEASYFWLIQKMQLVADVPTWWGAYEKAMHEPGMTEDKAVALADQAVRDAQGTGHLGDLSRVQRGGAGWKLFTNFYSFFNTTYNLTTEAVKRTDFKKPGDAAALGLDLLLLYTVPAMLSTLMRAALAGDWDDEDKLMRRLVAEQLTYLFGTVVLLREAGGAVQAAAGLPGDYGGPASLRLFDALSKLAKQTEQGELDEAFWKSLNSVAGLVFHYPAGQINATLSGGAALAEGRTDNPGALIVGAQPNR